MTLPPAEKYRLQLFARIVAKEIKVLTQSDERLYGVTVPAWTVADLEINLDLADRVESFVSRFGRLQDTLGDKLLPRLLTAVGEQPRAFVDNLAKAERMGWLPSGQAWVDMRALRNQMVHEYMEDPLVLAKALDNAHVFTTLLIQVAQNMIQEMTMRGWLLVD